MATIPHALAPHQGSFLVPAYEHASVADAMRPGVLECRPEATLTDVARLMAAYHVHCVVVGDDRGWGLITDRDLVRAAELDDPPATAGALATEPPSVSGDEALREAARRMAGSDASHLVVVSPDGERPVGMLSTLDVIGILAWGRG